MTTYLELFALFVLLMLPFLYETSHIFRYYFKFLLFYGIVSINSIVLIPAFLIRPCDVRNLLWASTFCYRISSLIGLRWELRGKQHLEKEQACIIVANHQSSLDILGMFDIWHVMNKCTVVAKRELFYAWPFGLAAWLAGLIFIDRVRGDEARETLNSANSHIKRKKIKLWVFPEGTRRNTGEVHPFKKGAFHMAINEQIPILPVVFSSYCTFLNNKKRILNDGNIIVTALDPVPTTGLTKDDLPKLMDHIHSLMSETFKHTSSEILQRYAAQAIIKKKIVQQSTGEQYDTTINNSLPSSTVIKNSKELLCSQNITEPFSISSESLITHTIESLTFVKSTISSKDPLEYTEVLEKETSTLVDETLVKINQRKQTIIIK